MVNRQENLSAVFAALAHPARRGILEHLSGKGESRVTMLARPFGLSLPAISKHLRVLEDARLVKRRREGRVHLIRPDGAGLNAIRKWISRRLELY